MELRLYNTLTRSKQPFRPLDPARVRMYVCGPTVYDFAHIGNARPVIVFDVLFRLLRHLYGADRVTYVRNVTDVDDKIIARARENLEGQGGGDLNKEIRRITDETYRWFKEDVAALGCLEPTREPRATEYVRRDDGALDMVTLIQRLLDNKNAYVAEGHVLFDVGSMSDYGRLARRSLDEMIAGARVEVAPYKRNPMDFVLWKPSTPDEPGWHSPWGRGRPGWHIECSAMSAALLGETFDIHGGGIDLVFPHHENEIAQSRCAFRTDTMAQVWMHNGFLQVEGEKMAKSAGNFITIRQLLTDWEGYAWPGEALRFNMLRTQYRQPLDWTRHGLDESHKVLWDWYGELDGIEPERAPPPAMVEALCDDLNTPQAIVELHRLKREGDAPNLLAALRFLGFSGKRENLGRTARAGEAAVAAATVSSETVNGLIAARAAARKARNFREADRIRDELAKMGVVLHDTPDGTTWEIAR